MKYFIERYQTVLTFSSSVSDQIFDELVAYQLMERGDIPLPVWECDQQKLDESNPDDEVFLRMDVIWSFLSKMKTGDGVT